MFKKQIFLRLTNINMIFLTPPFDWPQPYLMRQKILFNKTCKQLGSLKSFYQLLLSYFEINKGKIPPIPIVFNAFFN